MLHHFPLLSAQLTSQDLQPRDALQPIREQKQSVNGNQRQKRGLSRRLVREAQAQEQPQALTLAPHSYPGSAQTQPKPLESIPNHSQSPSDNSPAALTPHASLTVRVEA